MLQALTGSRCLQGKPGEEELTGDEEKPAEDGGPTPTPFTYPPAPCCCEIARQGLAAENNFPINYFAYTNVKKVRSPTKRWPVSCPNSGVGVFSTLDPPVASGAVQAPRFRAPPAYKGGVESLWVGVIGIKAYMEA
jgi:hypothetical protein